MQSPKTATGDCSSGKRAVKIGELGGKSHRPFHRATIHLSCIMNGMQAKAKRSLAGHGTKPPPKSLTKAKHIYSAVAKKDTGGGKMRKGEEIAAMCKNPKICVRLCSVF